MNLGDMLLGSAEKFPLKTALVVDEESRTYGELNDRVNRLANALLGLGLGKGDLIGILSMNSVPWVEALYAILKIGAVAVPFNYRLLEGEILKELQRNDVAALFVSPEHLEVAQAYQGARTKPPLLILLHGAGAEGIPSVEQIQAGSDGTEPSLSVSGSDVAAILFTGGTTGLPKGAVCTHEMLFWTTVSCMTSYETPRTDHIMLHPFPLFHGSGMFRVISYMSAGATYVTMAQFDAEMSLRLIEAHGVTAFIGSSAVFMPMYEIKQKMNIDTRSVTHCIATFAFMDHEGRRRLKTLFPNAATYEGYGSTEGGPISALSPDQRPDEPGSVGRAAMHMRLKIVDDEGTPLPGGQVGEIVVKGPNVAKGYHNDPEETRAAFRDGWFHSGDLGKLDSRGFLYVVDRKKDMIKTGGENVYSREVEAVLLQHPDVEEAAVIGVPHPRWGETIKAIVVKKKGAGVTESGLMEFCKTHLAGYKKPTSVDFAASIPKTETGGKVSKWMLRERYGTPR